MATKLYFKQVTFFVYVLLFSFYVLVYLQIYNKSLYSVNNDKADYNVNNRIVIGTVSCHKPNSFKENEETAVMIKSVLISANLNGISKVDFHIFLEYLEDTSYFSLKLREYGCINGTWKGVQVNMTFYPAVNPTLIPEKYHQSALPDVDSIIYFDTDIIVTGNIAKIWGVFGEMDERQLVGLPRNMEGDNPHFQNAYNKSFGDIPHVPPKGLNTGILLMNLTKMRKFDWEEKLLRVYDDYSMNHNLTVQKIVNILLYNDPGLHKLLTCEYHIFNKNCDQGLYCNYLEGSPEGIHVIHGAGNNFARPSKSLYDIFETYRTFNMTHGNFVNDVAKEIRKIYASPQKPNKRKSKCYGTLNKYLFNKYFDENENLVENAVVK